jgi:hypothetical protein
MENPITRYPYLNPVDATEWSRRQSQTYTVLGGVSGTILVESAIMASIKAEGDVGPSLDNAYYTDLRDAVLDSALYVLESQ